MGHRLLSLCLLFYLLLIGSLMVTWLFLCFVRLFDLFCYLISVCFTEFLVRLVIVLMCSCVTLWVCLFDLIGCLFGVLLYWPGLLWRFGLVVLISLRGCRFGISFWLLFWVIWLVMILVVYVGLLDIVVWLTYFICAGLLYLCLGGRAGVLWFNLLVFTLSVEIACFVFVLGGCSPWLFILRFGTFFVVQVACVCLWLLILGWPFVLVYCFYLITIVCGMLVCLLGALVFLLVFGILWVVIR